MNETETFWKQLFKDKPIDKSRLQSIKLNVMHHIREHPLDFQGQLMLAARKRWGMVLLGLLMISALIQVLIFYFRGYVLLTFLENLPSLILNFFPSTWQSYLWETIGSKVIILADIKSLIEILWFNYSWYLISIPVLFITVQREDSHLY